MPDEKQIIAMADKIRILRQTATELKQISYNIQTVGRNVDRILAGIKMLELNISDIAGLENQS